MLSAPKNHQRPESTVYLIGMPSPDEVPSVVFQVIFVANRLLLRQMVCTAAQGSLVTVTVMLFVTCVVPLLAVSV